MCNQNRSTPRKWNIPLLFNIFLNDLIKKVKTTCNDGINCFGCADDLLFTSKCIDTIKNCIQIIESRSKDSYMKLNKEKSGLMILFDKRGTFKNVENLLQIPRVSKYKYLGLTIDDKLDFSPHYKATKKKIYFISTKVYFLFKKSSLRFRRNCFELFISPLFLHIMCPFFYMDAKVKNKFMALWRTSFKKLMGLKKNTDKRVVELLKPYQFLDKVFETNECMKKKIFERLGEKISHEIVSKQKLLREYRKKLDKNED